MSLANFLQTRNFFSSRKRWKSLGVLSGEYCVCLHCKRCLLNAESPFFCSCDRICPVDRVEKLISVWSMQFVSHVGYISFYTSLLSSLMFWLSFAFVMSFIRFLCCMYIKDYFQLCNLKFVILSKKDEHENLLCVLICLGYMLCHLLVNSFRRSIWLIRSRYNSLLVAMVLMIDISCLRANSDIGMASVPWSCYYKPHCVWWY